MSPEEIVKRMKEEYPFDMAMRISHEAVYQYIYVLPRGSLKQTLIKGLRQERRYRRKKGKHGNAEEARGKIADMLSIEERPSEVAERVIPGHWEGDLIMGTDFSKVSTRTIKQVERELNDRPRRVLSYQKPDEVFNQLVALKV